MTVENMHFDFKMKLNKVDSAKNRNFRPEEIDWLLNEAMDIFIKQRYHSKSFDDLKELVIVDKTCDVTTYNADENLYKADFSTFTPSYMYYISGHAFLNKTDTSCATEDRYADLYIRELTSRIQHTAFADSSYEWQEIACSFINTAGNDSLASGLLLYTDGTFTIKHLKLNYVKIPKRIAISNYSLLDGTSVTKQDCELNPVFHNHIVDLSVALAAGNLQMPDLNYKMQKISFNN